MSVINAAYRTFSETRYDATDSYTWMAEINSYWIYPRGTIYSDFTSQDDIYIFLESAFLLILLAKKVLSSSSSVLSKHPNNVPIAPCPKPARITLHRKMKHRRAHERPAVSMWGSAGSVTSSCPAVSAGRSPCLPVADRRLRTAFRSEGR